MKVRELIAMLSAVDPELDVKIEYEINDSPDYTPVDRVVHKAQQWAAVVVPRVINNQGVSSVPVARKK